MKRGKWILMICTLAGFLLFADGIYILAALKGERQIEQKQSKVTDQRKFQEESSISYDAPMNILVLGLDEYKARTDVILLFNYIPEANRLNILSICRDTRIYVKNKPVKINSLISIGGEKLVAGAIETMTGLTADFFVVLDFDGFRKIIDTLDGVEFNVPFNMDYDDPDQNLHIHLKKGSQVLNGKKAEQLVRYRKGNRNNEGYEDGDIGRMKMQQHFIEALIQQKLKLKYLSRADEIYFILREHLSTNIEVSHIRDNMKNISNFDYHNIKLYTLPGEGRFVDGVSYFIQNNEKTKKMIDEEFLK
jgi:LCP family protein required for cell wall assembly